MTSVVAVVGVVMIAGGVVLVLRAAAAVRADLVAKLVNIEGRRGVILQQLRAAARAGSPPPRPQPLEIAPFNNEIRWREK